MSRGMGGRGASSLFALLALMGISIGLCGCSLLGLGIGAVIDGSSRREVPRAEIPNLERGRNVDVYARIPVNGDGTESRKVLDGDFSHVADDRLYVLSTMLIDWRGRDCTDEWQGGSVCEAATHFFDGRIGITRDNDGLRAAIPLSSVDRVTVHESSGAWWKGLLIGLAVDIAVVAILIATWEPPEID